MDKLRYDRTLTRLLLAIGAMVLGIVAQNYFAPFRGGERPSTLTDGLLVYGVAVTLFAAAVLRARRLPGLPLRPILRPT
jgi:hypothetical protein